MKNFYPENSYIMAPLTDYTDLPFRKSIGRFGAEYCFTQMIDAGALVWSRRTGKKLAEKNQKIITRGAEEKRLGVQLLGNDPEILAEAVEILNEEDFDVLDLNMGCPMRKIITRGCGAAMYLNADNARRCLDVLVAKSKVDVTAKTRIISRENLEENVLWARQLESTGIKALTVHGRLREAIYAGDVAFDMLRGIDEALKIQVIANGGIFSAVDALELKEKTQISCGMVARGAIGNPWLFHQLQGKFMAKVAEMRSKNLPIPDFAPSPTAFCKEMRENFNDMLHFHGEETACRVARKLILGYLKGRGYLSSRKDMVGHLASSDEYFNFFNLLESEGPSPNYQHSVMYYEDFI